LGYSNYSAAKELLGQDTGSSGFWVDLERASSEADEK
jgi:hypothetical protein